MIWQRDERELHLFNKAILSKVSDFPVSDWKIDMDALRLIIRSFG
jgi:hypothetical protein